MSKKILEVCLSPNLGGLELFAFHCYKNFKQRSMCKIAVAKAKKLDNYFESDDKIYIERNKFCPFIPALKLARYIDKYEIDVIHFHWTKDMITVVLAKLLSKRKPQIVQSRHMGMTRFKDDFYHRFIYKQINMIHSVTQKVSQQLKKYIPAQVRPKVTLVYLGVEIEPVKIEEIEVLTQEYSILDKEFIIGIFGRIERQKGQHIVLEALEKLKNLPLRLFIVGDCMDEAYLKELKLFVKNKGLQRQVVFTGFTKKVRSYMSLCDISVLATENETFGLVVIESMAQKTPVIAVNKGGPLEIITDKKDGMFYDGTSNDLALKIEILYENHKLLTDLSLNALRTVQKKFNYKESLDRLYMLLEREL